MSRKQKRGLARIGAGAVLLAAAWLLPLEGWASLGGLRRALCRGGLEVLWKAVRNILHGQVFDENFLMALATVGAFATGEYSEGVAVMLFYQIGEWFQRYAVGRSRQVYYSADGYPAGPCQPCGAGRHRAGGRP